MSHLTSLPKTATSDKLIQWQGRDSSWRDLAAQDFEKVEKPAWEPVETPAIIFYGDGKALFNEVKELFRGLHQGYAYDPKALRELTHRVREEEGEHYYYRLQSMNPLLVGNQALIMQCSKLAIESSA